MAVVQRGVAVGSNKADLSEVDTGAFSINPQVGDVIVAYSVGDNQDTLDTGTCTIGMYSNGGTGAWVEITKTYAGGTGNANTCLQAMMGAYRVTTNFSGQEYLLASYSNRPLAKGIVAVAYAGVDASNVTIGGIVAAGTDAASITVSNHPATVVAGFCATESATAANFAANGFNINGATANTTSGGDASNIALRAGDSITPGNGTYTATLVDGAYGWVLLPAATSTLTTAVGTATAAGGSGGMSAVTTLTTVVGTASAVGGDSTFRVPKTFSATTVGTADAVGGTGAMSAPVVFGTATGTARAEGRMGCFSTIDNQFGTITDVVSHGVSGGSGWSLLANTMGSLDGAYGNWASDVSGATAATLYINDYGTWASLPADASCTVNIRMRHKESHTGAPLSVLSVQAFLDSTPLGSATNCTLSLTDRDEDFNVSLTGTQLKTNTLSVAINASRV